LDGATIIVELNVFVIIDILETLTTVLTDNLALVALATETDQNLFLNRIEAGGLRKSLELHQLVITDTRGTAECAGHPLALTPTLIFLDELAEEARPL
jgi:hypothetical protein